MKVDVCNEVTRFTVQMNMTFSAIPKRMIHGHTISYKTHSFCTYRKGSRLEELHKSTTCGHDEFMVVQALSNQTDVNDFFFFAIQDFWQKNLNDEDPVPES